LVSPFLDQYTFRYWIYKFSSKTNLEKHLEIEMGWRQLFGPAEQRGLRGASWHVGGPAQQRPKQRAGTLT
jgi:hypothetical protein